LDSTIQVAGKLHKTESFTESCVYIWQTCLYPFRTGLCVFA